MEERKTVFFDSFREVVKTITSTLDVQEVLNLLVDKVTQTMNLKASAIRLLNPENRTLELVASTGLSDKYLNKGPVEADQSIASAMKGEKVIIKNAPEDTRTQYPKEDKEEGIVGIVSIPLSIKGKTIGVLRLYTGEYREFSEDEINFAESLAEMGTIAIENARMYESIKNDYQSMMSDLYTFVGYSRSL